MLRDSEVVEICEEGVGMDVQLINKELLVGRGR